jgi:recombination protein RecA
LKASRVQSELESRLSAEARTRLKPEYSSQAGFSTGIPEIDTLVGTLPRGAITIATGPASSGRTTLMLSTISKAISEGDMCALIDTGDAFDVASADVAGFDLDRLLWVRCGNNLQHALNATEIVLQSAGFGLVVLDAALVSPRDLHSIPDSCWFRFRRSVENTLTSLLIIGPANLTISCSAIALELERGKPRWTGAPSITSPLLGIEFAVKRRKPFPAMESQTIYASLVYDIPV